VLGFLCGGGGIGERGPVDEDGDRIGMKESLNYGGGEGYLWRKRSKRASNFSHYGTL